MKKTKKFVLAAFSALLLSVTGTAFAKEIGNTFNAEFRIKSRTSFGVDLDSPYNLGLKQELLDFAYVMHVGPGYVSNQFSSDVPVGFINFSVYDIAITPVSGDKVEKLEGTRGEGEFYDYWDSGKFSAGIAWKNFLLTLNGKNTESFWLPWNKAFENTDDKIRVSWASMDTVVGAVRTKRIIGSQPLDSDQKGRSSRKWTGGGNTYLVEQDDGTMDKLHFAVDGQMIGLMYNMPDVFGVNLKFATENSFDSDANSEHDYNGIAAGLDFVVTPKFLKGLRILGSAAGTWNYGADHNADPFAAGVKASYSIALNEDITVEPYAGFDAGFFLKDNNKFSMIATDSKTQYQTGLSGSESNLPGGGFEASCGILVRWPGQRGWYTDYITGDEGRVFSGMALGYSFYNNPDDSDTDPSHSMKFTLFEPTGHEGVLYFVGSEVIADLKNIGQDNWSLLATGYVDCPLDMIVKNGILTPFVTLYYDNLPYEDGDDILRQNAFKADVGVKLSELIPNTIVSVLWNSGNLIEDKDVGAEVTKGYLRCAVEITF